MRARMQVFFRKFTLSAVPAALTLAGCLVAPLPALAAPLVSIAQYPLTVAQPAHPQVLFALANSQSMDGDLSGAIYTGSGAIGASLAGLNSSSSPINYTIPVGFTPPVNPGAAGMAPYTVVTAGVQYDNSASRLNVSKAGISSILQSFISNADFGLIDYSTSGLNEYTTWVYYMSQPGGFTFTNSPGANDYVANPCYNIPLDFANPVDADCFNLNTRYPGINTYQDMLILASSDDPSINDVLYAGGESPVCVVYGGPFPATPFPPNYSLGQYEGGGVLVGYSTSLPNPCANVTGPTNAGYVPYSTEVMYAQRGYGFYTFGETANDGGNNWNPTIAMTSAGQVPTTASVNAAISGFTPYLAPETDLTGSQEIKASATQSPIAGILDASGRYFSTNPASSNGCAPNRYVVLVTDGLPTLDLSGNNWPPLGSAAAAGYGVFATFNGDGSLTTSNTNDQALIDTINKLTSLKTAGVNTYIIGVGAGVDPAANPTAAATMTAMAIAGGTNTFFAANSPAELNTDMQVILAQILAETASTASSSVNSTGINSKSVAYQGQFTTSDLFQDWTGNLLAFPINITTGAINTAVTNELWASQPLLDAQNWDVGRKIVTWDPVAAAGAPFRWNGNPAAVTGIASSTILGHDLETFAADANGQDVLQFLRGSNAQELRNGGQFRNRTHKLGDIVNSAPAYVAGPAGPWQQSSYFAFANLFAHRAPIVYVGGNDGMLHAFDASVGNATSGQELFAYVPNGVFQHLINLVNPFYNEQHRYFVDGSPQVQDVLFSDATWHTVLIEGERAGGGSIFALDVTDPSTFTTETALAHAVLWEFTDANMGDTFSTPAIANTAAGFAVLFGNGYNSPTGRPFLYAVNPQTGVLIGKVDLCGAVPAACNGALPNGLSSVAAMNTYGSLSGPVNVVYAGDLQGNVWRVDISNANPANWTVSVLFQARDSGGNPQPITVTPAVTLNPNFPNYSGTMVYVGTGEFLGVPDLTNTQVQTVYGIYDAGTASATPLTRANLQVQTMSTALGTNFGGQSVTLRLLTSTAVNIKTTPGWYVDLSLATGERIVTDPQLFNGTLQVTSYQPNQSTCTAGGNGFFMTFNYVTGGATAVPQFDWFGNNQLSNSDLIGGKTVSGIALGANYGSTPSILTGNLGAGTAGAEGYVTLGGATSSGTLPNGSSFIQNWAEADGAARGAWQEIRR